ncbi:DUF202 domain-containing protein [Cellulomonas sp. Y8]|uniref:DUF202 domain-containing protein n=1 Tax=Cellulomonas sp. Y8 TaxID=2591145 RepID=UPI003D747591
MLLDAGLQPERTTLAWRRTILSLLVVVLVVERLVPPHLDTVGVVAAAAGTLSVVTTAVLAARRSRHVADALRDASPEARVRMPGSGPLLVLASAVTAGAGVGWLAILG